MGVPFYGRVPICMACASRQIRQQSIREGLWPGGGEGIAWVCDDCHHIGPPFLADPPGEAHGEDALWKAEYEDAAFALDDEAWGPPTTTDGLATRRPLGILLIGIGIVFLTPALATITPAALTGDPFYVIGEIVRVALLLGLGIACVAIGWTFLRRPPSEPKGEPPAPKESSVDEASSRP